MSLLLLRRLQRFRFSNYRTFGTEYLKEGYVYFWEIFCFVLQSTATTYDIIDTGFKAAFLNAYQK